MVVVVVVHDVELIIIMGGHYILFSSSSSILRHTPPHTYSSTQKHSPLLPLPIPLSQPHSKRAQSSHGHRAELQPVDQAITLRNLEERYIVVIFVIFVFRTEV